MAQKGNTSEERLKSEGGREKEETLGIPLDGTADPTGEFPKRYNWFGNSQSAAGRGVRINKVNVQGGSLDMNFDVSAPSPSIYPFNYAMETPIGHSFEIDDTPGNERILLKHHTGAGIEIQPDGTVIVSSAANTVHVTNGDHNLSVTGEGHIAYDGNLHMKVNGNYNVDVSGTYNMTVGNNYNNQIKGTFITEVGDTHQTIVRGNKDTKIYGDNNDFIVGDKRIITKKDIRMLSNRDIISNAHRHVRNTAEGKFTASTADGISLVSEKINIAGRKGKIGGDNFHYLGTLFTGPSGGKGNKRNDQGENVVFHGNLIGRALEAWTAKYAQKAKESHSAYRSEYAKTAKKGGSATRSGSAAGQADYEANVEVPEKTGQSKKSSIKKVPDYKFKWGWKVEDNTAYEQPLNVLENYEWDGKGDRSAIDPIPIAPFYTTNEDWFEVWNKVSPFAVRKVMIDGDGWIEKKLYKPSVYSHYFQTVPDTNDIRSKLRTMDKANDPKTCPEMQCDNKKATSQLLFENRLSDKYLSATPPPPYEIKRSGNDFKSRYGYTLLGNPVERASKTFTSRNKAQSRKILVDPKYNPLRQESPISNSTKLSKSTSMATFLGAVGSKSTLEAVPIAEDRVNLARYWVCQAQIMEGVNSSPLFDGFRLAVTEGYYEPSSGIREHYKPGEDPEKKFWREPYRNEDGGIKNRLFSSGHPCNQRKHEGMLVYYTLFDSRGKINYTKTWECALFIRDNFYFRELLLDYDVTRPDDIMTVQIGIYLPVLYEEYRGMFEQKVGTYFNRTVMKENDLLEITDL
jgi:hypothetical protein